MVNDNPLENAPVQNNAPAAETTPLPPPPPDAAKAASQHRKLAYIVGAICLSVAVVLAGGVAAFAAYKQNHPAADTEASESISSSDSDSKNKAVGEDDAATRYGLKIKNEDPLTWDDILKGADYDSIETVLANDPLSVCSTVTLWVDELKHNYSTDIMCNYNEDPEYPGKIVIEANTISSYAEETNVTNVDALFVVQPDGKFHCDFILYDINGKYVGKESKDYDYMPSGNEAYRDYLDLPTVRSNPELFTVDDAY